jgi:flagellar biosynthesis/type III secretory pathway M-ring protein FliF/YscJ
VAAAKTSFLHGDQWAYLAGIVAVVIGAAVVFFLFPKNQAERRMLAEYATEDAAAESKSAG